MKNKILIAALCLCLLGLLSGCGGSPAPEPTAEPSPSPSPSPEITQMSITNESAEEILALIDIPSLKSVDASASTQYEALLKLYEARPDCEVSWVYEFDGVEYPSTATELRAVNLDGLEDALRYLPELTYVDVIDSPATIDDMDRFYDIRPEIDYYWSFKHDGFVIRTDIQCYSSLRDADYHRFTDEEMYPMLKYCKHLKALDLGHCDITDLSLIGNLSELQVLILADNPNLLDASPLAKLENLEYFEFFMNRNVEDYSFLNSLTKIKDINLCYCDNLGDLSFLENMPDFSFGLFKYSGISDEEIAKWQELYPDSRLVNYDGNIHSCDSGWRDTERNAAIRRAFTLWQYVTDYPSYDSVVIDTSSVNYPQSW